ncbi:MAG: hypothetical protein NTY30_03450 [Candidatus Berkelbacteria bacterium]|nr:hypothetical protein [Candidatus Berkelbacteria bacterium]
MGEGGEKIRPYEERTEAEQRFHDEATIRSVESEPVALKLSRVAFIGAEALNEDPDFSVKQEYEKYLDEMQDDATNQNEVFDRNVKNEKILNNFSREIAVKILIEIAQHPEKGVIMITADKSLLEAKSVTDTINTVFTTKLEKKISNQVNQGLMDADYKINSISLELLENGDLRIEVDLPTLEAVV